MLELREGLLDRVQVWAVWRQEEQMRSGIPDGLTDCLALVAAKVIHHHDVAARECRNENALHIGAAQ